MTEFEWKCISRIRRDCQAITFSLKELETAVRDEDNNFDVIDIADKLDYICDDISNMLESGNLYR